MSPASRRRKKVHRFRVGGWYKGFSRLVVKQIRKEVCIRSRFWHFGIQARVEPEVKEQVSWMGTVVEVS